MRAAGKEKELKPRKKPGRVPTSCAECRRLKLRCDRNVPCEKCISRGCGSICPNGALTPGKNNKMILANTEELHDRIDHLTARIHELEAALQTLQSQVSDEPHPILRKDSFQGLPSLLAPSGSGTSSSADSAPPSVQVPEFSSPVAVGAMRLDPAPTVESCGTLSISENGQSSFFGPTARLEFLAHRTTKPVNRPSRLTHELFDSVFEESQAVAGGLGQEIWKFRPSPSEAFQLCELYLTNGKIMYSAIPRSELFDDILMTVYRAESFSDLQRPETLALLFIVFAISSHFDTQKQSNNDSIEHYYLAKACLRLASHREHTLIYVQALLHMVQYLHFSGTESPRLQSEYLSRAIRIGYEMGLHYHGVRWNLSEDLSQERTRIFCELFLHDTWMSFYSGRPPMISLAFVDGNTPKDYNEGLGTDGNRKPGFHTWTYKYAVLLHSVMAMAFGPRPPSYSTILDLDLKIRNFPVPVQWRPISEQEAQPQVPEVQMMRFLVSFAKESTLLNLHRSYFMCAVEELPQDLSKHPFIPSVLAIYRSAWRLMRALRFIWESVPTLISRFSVAWSQGLSGAVVMCLFVTRTPGSHLTDPALNELNLLVDLFEEASPTCQAANNLLDDLRSLRRHARATAGRPYENEGYPISTSDLERLSGKTYLLMLPETKSTTLDSLSPSMPQQSQQPYHQRVGSHPTIKRDPSPSRATSATLSDHPAHSPYSMTGPLPVPPIHAPTPSAPLSLPPSHSNPSYPYSRSHLSSSHGPNSPYSSRAGDLGNPHASTSRAVQPSAPSMPAPPSQSSIPTSTQHTLHPILLQDIRDFNMRGAPPTSSSMHYFDFPHEGNTDVGSAPPRMGASYNYSHGHPSGRSASTPTPSPVSGSGGSRFRTRGYQSPQFTQPQSRSLSQGHGYSPNHEPDYGFFQSMESSFHLEYAPQPRSPFSAANFAVGMGGSGGVPVTDSSYQNLVEHLGFN